MNKHSKIAAFAVTASALAVLPFSSIQAQRQQASSEQRIDRLEREVGQMQRQVFPKGRPADTAGFPDDPAAPQSSVIRLDQRLDALERQMQDILLQSEDNGNSLRTLQADLAKLRSDSEARSSALEQRISDAAVGASQPVSSAPSKATADQPAKSKPMVTPPKESGDAATPAGTAGTDPGEDAYTQGFKLWEANKSDEAIASLKSFVAKYPKHRRVSFANNLIGRALLDQGKAREATQVLLANYRQNPGGERAPDSLLYLGQALQKMGQSSQACKAYSEFDAVFGAKARADLKKQVADGKAESHC